MSLLENSSTQEEGPVKADPVKRATAFVIDSVIAALIGFIPLFGGILGGFFFLFRDALPFAFLDGKSPGKYFIGLGIVLRDVNSGPMDYAMSAKRNWMFALNLLIAVPVIGWMAAPLVAVVGVILVAIEVFRVFMNPEGRRIGDMMAGTQVIEK
jgi:uncharacterized RDD family membrane protein YckC